MPEGPEVKLLTEKVSSLVVGKQVVSACVLSGKYLTKQKIQGWDLFLSKLPLNVVEMGCHGKFIYLKFDQDIALGVGLGMVGTFTTDPDAKHNRIVLGLENGRSLCYNDFRNFGHWCFYQSWNDLDKKIGKLGVDVLSEDGLNIKEVDRIYHRCLKQNICKVLMNQDVISSIGNYLKAECLYREKVYPLVNVGDLGLEKFRSIISTARSIGLQSYDLQKTGGISYRGFAVAGEDQDYIPLSKSQTLFMVYDQKQDPMGFDVSKMTTPDGRTTSWVPQVQTIGSPGQTPYVQIPCVKQVVPIISSGRHLNDQELDELVSEDDNISLVDDISEMVVLDDEIDD